MARARSIVVLGARHLGEAVIDRFAAHGWGLGCVVRSEETASRVRARHPDALVLALDAAEPGALARVAQEAQARFGGIDAAVNAIAPRAPADRPFGGGRVLDAPADALDPYTRTLVPIVLAFFRDLGAVMAKQRSGTLVQVTGGSALRAIPGRSAWTAGAFATRALAQAAAIELRDEGVHAALLVVDAVIASDKTEAMLKGEPEDYATTHEDVVRAIEYLCAQSPRGWTHELRVTPRGDRYLP